MKKINFPLLFIAIFIMSCGKQIHSQTKRKKAPTNSSMSLRLNLKDRQPYFKLAYDVFKQIDEKKFTTSFYIKQLDQSYELFCDQICELHLRH
jgi:hypothetical protein